MMIRLTLVHMACAWHACRLATRTFSSQNIVRGLFKSWYVTVMNNCCPETSFLVTAWVELVDVKFRVLVR